MKKLCMCVALATIVVLSFGNFSTKANNGSNPGVARVAVPASGDDATTFKARLRGLGEAPPVATQATGSFPAPPRSDGRTPSHPGTHENPNAQGPFLELHHGLPKRAGRG